MKKSIRSFIIFTAVITLSLTMLAGCGAESNNENQKDNIQGTTNSENVGSKQTLDYFR